MALRQGSRLRSLPPASEIQEQYEPIKLKALQAPVLSGAPPAAAAACRCCQAAHQAAAISACLAELLPRS